MSQYIRRLGAPLALTAALLVGCNRDARNANDTSLAQDTALSRDLQMANRDTTVQPQLQDVPAPSTAAPAPAPSAPSRPEPRATRPAPRATRPAPRPTTSRPAPTPSAPTTTSSGNTVTPGRAGSERALGSIPAGSVLQLASNSKVCTNTNKVGDRMTATVSEPVTGSNGATIPAGATVTLEVTELNRSDNANDKIRMGFAVRSVSFGGKTYPLDADVTSASIDRVRSTTKSDDMKKVIGGAVAGAVLGQVLGKNTKGTVIGAAAGAAAGTAAAAATANFEGCVNNGGRMTIRLTGPVQVPVA